MLWAFTSLRDCYIASSFPLVKVYYITRSGRCFYFYQKIFYIPTFIKRFIMPKLWTDLFSLKEFVIFYISHLFFLTLPIRIFSDLRCFLLNFFSCYLIASSWYISFSFVFITLPFLVSFFILLCGFFYKKN